MLPEEILNALSDGKISDGHTRPLLMLVDKKEEQMTLFKEIMAKKMTVREAEMIARKTAIERVRKHNDAVDPALIEMEAQFKESLGTRVHIERKEVGGKITIDFFSADDLEQILAKVKGARKVQNVSDSTIVAAGVAAGVAADVVTDPSVDPAASLDDRSKDEIIKDEETEDMYSVKNFSL